MLHVLKGKNQYFRNFETGFWAIPEFLKFQKVAYRIPRGRLPILMP